MNAAESSHLSPETVAASKALLHETQTSHCVHTEEFRTVHKAQAHRGGEDLREGFAQLLCDPQICVSCRHDIQNSDHDVFHEKEMDEF